MKQRGSEILPLPFEPSITTPENKLSHPSLIKMINANKNKNNKSVLNLNGGSQNKIVKTKSMSKSLASGTANNGEDIKSSSIPILWMTLAMSIHYSSYEFIRNSSMSLFTSPNTKLSKIVHPLSMSLLSPFSTLLLVWYSHLLHKDNGNKNSSMNPSARLALRYTTILSIVVWISFGVILYYLKDLSNTNAQFLRLKQTIVILSFLFQHSYVYLLSTQYWSFITSIVRQQQDFARSKSNNPTYFSTIAGVSSITSTISASCVPYLLKLFPLEALLSIAGCMLLICLFCSEYAFSLAATSPITKNENNEKSVKKEDTTTGNSIQSAKVLFKRVPILGALFLEEVIFQCLVTVSNVYFVTKLRVSIFNDNDRATWTGKYFGYINGCSGILQFMIMPLLVKYMNLLHVRRMLPVFMFISTTILTLSNDNAIGDATSMLMIASIPFFLIKLIDYSFRGVLNEMVYLPLDFESRYFGKEIIGVLASRCGKSGISLVLSFLFAFLFDKNDVRILSYMTNVMSILWCIAVFRLCRFIDGSATKGNEKIKNT